MFLIPDTLVVDLPNWMSSFARVVIYTPNTLADLANWMYSKV